MPLNDRGRYMHRSRSTPRTGRIAVRALGCQSDQRTRLAVRAAAPAWVVWGLARASCVRRGSCPVASGGALDGTAVPRRIWNTGVILDAAGSAAAAAVGARDDEMCA